MPTKFSRYKVVRRKGGHAVLDMYSTKDIGVWKDEQIAKSYAERKNGRG